MTSSSTRIQTIYKSRNTILDLLKMQNYDTTDYSEFSINEIDAMYANSQLDMLVKHTDNARSIYIKYHLSTKRLRPNTDLDEIIEDLFVIEGILTKADTLIIIVNEEPNESMIMKMKYLYEHDGIFIVMHNISRLQYNILRHQYVPEMRVLTAEETVELKNRYNLVSVSKLPEISRFDPQALVMNVRPGEVCYFKRFSPTALTTDYYRVCV